MLVLAVLLLAFAGTTFVFAPRNFALRSASLVAILVSVRLVLVSNVQGRQGLDVASGVVTSSRTGSVLDALSGRLAQRPCSRLEPHTFIYAAMRYFGDQS